MSQNNACLPIDQMPVGLQPSGSLLYIRDYLIFDPTGNAIRVVEEDERDENGVKVGIAHGLSTYSSVYICSKLLFVTFTVEFEVWQNGPIGLEFHDANGTYRGRTEGPFAPPQGVRRYLSVYYPTGIGFFGIFGKPSGVAEGLVMKICPCGESIGSNPAYPKEGDTLPRVDMKQ